ncbi:hypothetical protein JTE90_003495 [Oedothorax gibbosus]|uniref:Uncharacterized protein n=1 Tax=Oedothorax gibbosus TaxID=931172 RepID=A0AAV6UF72_9ARAC|nr:hypothetical protein JTE90_003495 [Oedothorax gibbosus]
MSSVVSCRMYTPSLHGINSSKERLPTRMPRLSPITGVARTRKGRAHWMDRVRWAGSEGCDWVMKDHACHVTPPFKRVTSEETFAFLAPVVDFIFF